MKQLGSIQYDPLNVVGRNADLVLHSRVDGYTTDMLQQLLYKEHYLVDGFDKEMCIYTTKDYSKFDSIRMAHTKNSVIGTMHYRGHNDEGNTNNGPA